MHTSTKLCKHDTLNVPGMRFLPHIYIKYEKFILCTRLEKKLTNMKTKAGGGMSAVGCQLLIKSETQVTPSQRHGKHGRCRGGWCR